MISTLEGCGGLERTDFHQFPTLRGCGGLERADFQQFPPWEDVVVLRTLDLRHFLLSGSVFSGKD